VTSNVVGRHPNGSCANRRLTLSRGTPWQPQRRHHRSCSAAATRQASTAPAGSSRWPTTSNPSPSRRQNELRSGQAKVTSGIVEVLQLEA